MTERVDILTDGAVFYLKAVGGAIGLVVATLIIKFGAETIINFL